MNRSIPVAAACVAALVLQAQSAPVDLEAKFVKVLLQSNSQFGFACGDPALAAKLEALGVSVGPGFKFAWAASQAEVRSLHSQGHFVICPNLDWLKEGAAMAMIQEEGKPQLYLHVANAKATGVTLSDAVVRIARKVQ